MSVTVTPAHRQQILAERSDIEGRCWATDAEIHEGCEWDAGQRRVRLYPYWRDNVVTVYGILRKRASQGHNTITERQIARDLYNDVGDDYDAYKRRQESVRRWLKALERMGFIRVQQLASPSGKTKGLRVELRAVSEVTALARGCSSAGSSASPRIRLPRRKLPPEEACQARVRPWCPRGGRGAPRRFDSPFLLGRVGHPGAPGAQALKGRAPGAKDQARAYAREGPDGDSVDAIERNDGHDGAAALERRLTAALGVGAASTLRRAEEAFVAALGPPAAGRLRSLPVIRRLLWALARLDRYGNFGQGGAGVGLQLLEARLEDASYDEPSPKHLGYFLPALEETGRRWKHTWAPQIKAERRARGVVRKPISPLELDRRRRSSENWARQQARKASPAGPPNRRRGKNHRRQAAS